MNYGLALMSSGRYQEALASFNQALLYTPNYFRLQINLGIVNGALGRADEARKHFDAAITLEPKDPESYTFYAKWLAKTDQRDQAITMLRTALRLDGDHGNAETLLASLLKNPSPPDTGAPAGSIPEGPSPAEKQQAADSYVSLSLAHYKAHRYRECIEAARKALELRPDDAEAYNNISAADIELKDWDGAIKNASKAIQLKPNFPIARQNLSYSLEQVRGRGK
jgi:tetratricopeptide (TPR) repeat protein